MPGDLTEVRLTLIHDLSWSEYEYIYHRDGNRTRTELAGNWRARYIIRAYHVGDKTPIYEFERYSDDLKLQPFTTSIALPAGEWDIYVWQDLVDNDGAFYNVSDFARIGYSSPYIGDTDRRDAFEGQLRVGVESSYESGSFVNATVQLERPTAKYVFIATDFGKFYDEVLSQVQQNDFVNDKRTWSALSQSERKKLLAGYSVRAYYPLFMPSVYDMFQQKNIDSARGMSYEAQIEPINDSEAIVSFDYVFMNHRESTVQVMLALRTAEGKEISMTPTVAVPVLRKQITFVRGDFLTAGGSGGLDIDFDFSGDINIEI